MKSLSSFSLQIRFAEGGNNIVGRHFVLHVYSKNIETYIFVDALGNLKIIVCGNDKKS